MLRCEGTGITAARERIEYGCPCNDFTTVQSIRAAIEEDVGQGDITTDSIIPEGHMSEALIIAKKDTVIAGNAIVRKVFELFNGDISYEVMISDGNSARKGDTVARVMGRTRAILTAERVALNFFQRLSGIATATKRFVDAVKGTGVVVLDTRKTAPGLRALEKYAVLVGGGHSHRFNLSEMVLIKENHIAAAGSIREAVERIRARSGAFIEVEVKNMRELREAVDQEVDRIMLDNWTVRDTVRAVGFVNGRIPIEASGNMTIERSRVIAHTGINFISVGSLTHSPVSADLSLLIVEKDNPFNPKWLEEPR